MLVTLFVRREMQALRRYDLECFLKIYVELKETLIVSDKFCGNTIEESYLDLELACNSDCFG